MSKRYKQLRRKNRQYRKDAVLAREVLKILKPKPKRNMLWRKLRAKWSVETEQDLNCFYSRHELRGPYGGADVASAKTGKSRRRIEKAIKRWNRTEAYEIK